MTTNAQHYAAETPGISLWTHDITAYRSTVPEPAVQPVAAPENSAADAPDVDAHGGRAHRIFCWVAGIIMAAHVAAAAVLTLWFPGV